MEIGLLLAALGIGLSSGIHCLGMCGPIAISLGISSQSKNPTGENLFYQLGRITTYVFLGAVVGIVGTGFSIAGFQNTLTIIAGVLLVIMAAFSIKGTDWASSIPFLHGFLGWIRKSLGSRLRQPGLLARFTTGILNGLLPCGMVYIALTASLAAGGIAEGAVFMLFFGLGTLPFMFSAVLFGHLLTVEMRRKLLKWVPAVLMLIGVLFILRGLELGIPYVSPAAPALEAGTGADCH